MMSGHTLWTRHVVRRLRDSTKQEAEKHNLHRREGTRKQCYSAYAAMTAAALAAVATPVRMDEKEVVPEVEVSSSAVRASSISSVIPSSSVTVARATAARVLPQGG